MHYHHNEFILIQQLLHEIEKLPEDKLAEVVDFAQFLASRNEAQSPTDGRRAVQSFISSRDEAPLTAFIGGASHGALAKGIDEELYGS